MPDQQGQFASPLGGYRSEHEHHHLTLGSLYRSWIAAENNGVLTPDTSYFLALPTITLSGKRIGRNHALYLSFLFYRGTTGLTISLTADGTGFPLKCVLFREVTDQTTGYAELGSAGAHTYASLLRVPAYWTPYSIFDVTDRSPEKQFTGLPCGNFKVVMLTALPTSVEEVDCISRQSD